MAYRFVGLSTGRAGSRYFTKLLNSAGIHAVHEASVSNANYRPEGKIGEVSAHLVTAPLDESTRTAPYHTIRLTESRCFPQFPSPAQRERG